MIRGRRSELLMMLMQLMIVILLIMVTTGVEVKGCVEWHREAARCARNSSGKCGRSTFE